MADGVLIKIDGDDKGYETKLNGLEKKAKDAALKAQKAVEEHNDAVKKALEATDDKIKKSADNAVKETARAAKQAEKEAKEAAEAVARHNAKAMQSSADIIGGINRGVKTLATAGVAAGAAVLGIGVNYNMTMEEYNAGFKTMLGSAEEAAKLMEDLKGFSATTPFELTDLADASTTLLAFGEDVNNLMPDLQMLGDISLGNKEKFKGLALVFGQVKSQGKLMGQDLLQMINQGFNPLQIISEKTGKSVAQLKDEMSKGAITYEMVADAMRTATSEGGQFFNALQEQSGTASGQISTLKDNITAFFGEVSSGVSQTLTEDALPKAIEMVDWLNERLEDGSLEKFFKNAATGTVAFAAGLGALNLALVANDIIQVKKGVEGYTAATKLGTTAQKLFNAELLKNPYTWVAVALAALVAGIATYAATHKSAAEEISEANKEMEKSVKDLDESYKQSIEAIDDKRDAEIAEASQVNVLKDRLYELEDQIKSGTLTDKEAETAKKAFNKTASELESRIPGITSLLYDETGAIDVQRGSVNKLAEAYYNLAVAKAYVNAYQSKLNEIAKKTIKYEEKLETAKETEAEAKTGKDIAKKDYQIKKDNPLTYGIDSRNIAKAVYDSADSDYKDAQKATKTIIDKLDGFSEQEKNIKEKLTQRFETQIELEEELNKLTGGKTSNGSSGTTTGGGKSNSSAKKSAAEQELKDLKHQLEMEYITEAEYIRKKEELVTKHYGEQSNEYKQFMEEKKQYGERVYEKELSDLKYAKDRGTITEHQYYKTLAKFRDDYFDKTSDKYKELTREIDSYVKKWKESAEKVKDERDNLAEELSADNKSIRSITVHGGDKAEEYKMLADPSSDNRQLETYNRLIDQFTERNGGLSSFFAEELKALSVSEGIEYLTLLLTSTDEEFNKYMESLKRNDELARETANKLMSSELSELKTAFEDEFGELPQDFFVIGEDSAAQFSDGFLSEFKAMWDTIQSELSASFSSVSAVIKADVSKNSSSGPTIYDNRTYNSNISAYGPHQQHEAHKQLETYGNHTAVWKK